MAAKVAEADAGIHSLAVSIAVSGDSPRSILLLSSVYSLSQAGDCTVSNAFSNTLS